MEDTVVTDFEGEIHEVIGPSIRRSGGKTEPLDVIVHHFGLLASDDSLRKKAEVMARLAEAKCTRNPGHYKAHYELGVIAAGLLDFEKAERSFRKSKISSLFQLLWRNSTKTGVSR